MCWKKNLARSSWLMVGVGVMGVSLVVGQKQTVWGSFKQASISQMEWNVGNNDLSNEYFMWQSEEIENKLPEVEVLPGELWYPVKATHDLLWWRMAGSENQRAARWMHLANERLSAGWMLCEKGNLNGAVETLVKAESYLSKVMEESGGFWNEEWNDSVRMHYVILKDLESVMPEELKPRITELINVPKLAMELRQIEMD